MSMSKNHTSVTLCRSSFNSSAAVRPNAICSTLFDPRKNLFFQLKTKNGVGKRNISREREELMSLQMNKGKQHLNLSRIPVFLQLFFKVSHVMGPATQQTLRENKDQQRIQRKHNVVNGRKKTCTCCLISSLL